MSGERRPGAKATASGKLLAIVALLPLSWGTLAGCNCRTVKGEELSDSGIPDAGDGGACLIEDPCPVNSGEGLFVDSVAGADGPCCCGCGLPQSFSTIVCFSLAAIDITAALARCAISLTAAPALFAGLVSTGCGGDGGTAAT